MLDSFVTMKVIEEYTDGDNTITIEQSEGSYLVTMTALILSYLAVYGSKITDFKFDLPEAVAIHAHEVVYTFMHKLNIEPSYIFPSTRTEMSDKLISEAFEGTVVLRDYMNSKTKTIEQVKQEVSPLAKAKKIGRNSLCFCNSGKKYKKCCLNKTQNNLSKAFL